MSPAASEVGELWPGVVDAVPEVLAACGAEPAYSYEAGDIEFPDRRRHINPELSDEDLVDDLAKIGYPSAST